MEDIIIWLFLLMAILVSIFFMGILAYLLNKMTGVFTMILAVLKVGMAGGSNNENAV